MQGIHAWCPGSDAFISLARDARVDAGMSCSGRVHKSICLLWSAVLVIGPLCSSNMSMCMCMSYDWGITVTVHMHRGQLCSMSNLSFAWIGLGRLWSEATHLP